MGGPAPPRLLILRPARRTCGCTQSFLFSPLGRPLFFLLSCSSLCFQSNLESSLFPPPWLRRRREKGRNRCLRLTRGRRRPPSSIGRSYSTEKVWARSALLWPPYSTSAGGRRCGLRLMPPLTGSSWRSDSSLMPCGRVWFPPFLLSSMLCSPIKIGRASCRERV